MPDGVFTRADDEGAVVFRQGPAPTRADIAAVAARVEKRMTRWLRRRGLVDERAAEDRSNEAPELSPLEACMQLSLVDSTFLHLAGGAVPVPQGDHRFRAAAKGSSVFPLAARERRGNRSNRTASDTLPRGRIAS